MNPDKPDHQNPALPDFWEKRYREGTTPWNAGGVPRALQEFVDGYVAGSAAGWRANHNAPPRVLVPGCGHAWEARHLCQCGWDVLAIDFSPAAIAHARPLMGPYTSRLMLADFFAFAPAQPFDLIYERAFLCALPRHLWAGYAARCAELLAPGGLLAGFFFLGSEPKGPPFAIEPAALDALLAPAFERIADDAVEDSLAVFQGRERWQVWRRRANCVAG